MAACLTRWATLSDCPILDEGLAYLAVPGPRSWSTPATTRWPSGCVLDGGVLREGEPLTQRILGWSYAG